MLKFLRKYKTWILVVGGTLLMIAFLLPANINRLSLGGSGTFMTIGGHKVPMAEAQHAYREKQAISAVAPGMLEALGVQPEIDHWILLVRAAEELGLIGGAQDGRDYIPELAIEVATTALRHPLSRTNPDDMAALDRTQQLLHERRIGAISQLHLQERQVDEALAKFRGVARMIGMYSSMGQVVSLPRVAQEARRRLDQGIIDYVFIPATSLTFQSPEPTPEQIAAHYDKYKDIEPGQGEFGIGYRFGPRFQLEWLTINRSVINGLVNVSPVDVRKAFMQENPSGTDAQFLDQKAEIESRLKTAAVDRVMEVAAATVRAEIAKSLRKVETSGQYRELPADWMAQRPNLDAISAAVVGKLIESDGITIPPPAVTRIQDKWLTQAQLQQQAGIGRSTLRRGTRSGSFSQYAGMLKELAGPNELGLQVGIPGESTVDTQGNIYFFNVTAFKPAGPPENVEEVQTQVVSDLKKLSAYEQLKTDAEAYKGQAIAGGLAPLTHPPTGSPSQIPIAQLRENIGVTRTDQLFMDQSINSDAVKGHILDAVTKFDPKADLATIDIGQRVLVLPVPERLGLAVIVIKGYNATSAEAVRLRDTSVARVIGGVELREASGADDVTGDRGFDPFALDVLAKRYNAELSTEHKSMQERRAKDEMERESAGKPAASTRPRIETTPVR